jgi:ABC-2 type transport system permease protein
MIKFWRIASHEYLRHVLRKRFIFALLSLPLMIVVIALVGFLAVAVETSSKPAGYVDLSGWLSNPIAFPDPEKGGLFKDVNLLRFDSEKEARQALDAKQIQAYYVLESDYLQTGKVRLVAYEPPSSNVSDAFTQFLRANLLSQTPADVSNRILEGSQVVVRSPDAGRQFDSTQWYNMLLPILAGILFIIVINISGGYLLQAIVEEKENRMIEIVVTSVSPNQLMAGKVIGNLSVGLTQLLIWILFPAAAFLVLRTRVAVLQTVRFDTEFAVLSLLTLLLAFVMIAALMATIGATVAEAREAQQISGLFTLPMVVPFWFISQIMMNPNGTLAAALSIFPLTAPISLPLRAAFTSIPIWQMVLSLGLLAFSAVASVWFAGRAFRLGMLRYGKRIRLKEIFTRKKLATR